MRLVEACCEEAWDWGQWRAQNEASRDLGLRAQNEASRDLGMRPVEVWEC